MDEAVKTEDVQRERSRTRTAIWVVALIGGVVAGLIWLGGADERNARDACADYVKGEIRNPVAAEFTFSSTLQTGDGWEVYGSVDSDRRYSFRCAVKPSKPVTGYVI